MDTLSQEERSALMARIHGRDTTPELTVRRICRELGYGGYRLHRKDLPGSPDIAWIGRRIALFINGCFWHAHHCKKGRHMIGTNSEYWQEKFHRNRKRDADKIRELRALGWRVGLIWECELKEREHIVCKIQEFLEGHHQ